MSNYRDSFSNAEGQRWEQGFRESEMINGPLFCYFYFFSYFLLAMNNLQLNANAPGNNGIGQVNNNNNNGGNNWNGGGFGGAAGNGNA